MANTTTSSSSSEEQDAMVLDAKVQGNEPGSMQVEKDLSSATTAPSDGGSMDVASQEDGARRSSPSPTPAGGAPVASPIPAPTSPTPKDNLSLTAEEAAALLETGLVMADDGKGKRLKAVGKALVALEAAYEAEGRSPKALEALPLHHQAVEMVAVWRAGLGVGADVDACSLRDDKWYAGTLCAEVKDGDQKRWEVKFKRFSKAHNERFGQTGPEMLRLMPWGSHTGPKPKSERMLIEKWQRTQEAREAEEAAAARRLRETSSFLLQAPKATVVGTTRSGRAVKSENTAMLAPAAKQPRRSKKTAHEEAAAAATEDEPQQQQQQGFHVDTGGNDGNDWVCGTCDEMEKNEGDCLVLCDGPCKRAFHQSCLGLTSAEVEAVETWFCEQCQEKEHTCFVCGDTGKDDGPTDGVHKCQQRTCGKFYHAACVGQLPNAVISKQQQDGEAAAEAGEEGLVKFKFVCPMHVCDLCGKGRESAKNRSELYPCWLCPRAYHLNCIPPSCKYHEYLLLCPEHSEDMELPHLPGWDDGNAQAESRTAGAAEVGEHSEGWLSMVLSSLLPRGKTAFRLPVPVFDEVNSKPKPYGQIPCLKYLCKMVSKEPGPECQCVGQCGEGCLNRMLHIECVGGGKGGEEDGDGKKEKYHNCNVGPNCGNRAFKNKEYIKHQLFREGGCGWGLRTMEDVKKGQLVFEYVGEVIDDEILEARLTEHARDHPNDHNMYIMELESGYYLDARSRGNASRFINHSCAPNCMLQKWNVKGFTHIGIMAVTDIPAGTPLSYDYQFATNEEGKFKCHCGAPTCRGSLAPKQTITEDQAIELLRTGSRGDRKKLLELCKKRERRKQARKEQAAKQAAARKNLTSHLLPGDSTLEIRAGPPARWFRLARATRLFLVRNVKQGTDFLQRHEYWNHRQVQVGAGEGEKEEAEAN